VNRGRAAKDDDRPGVGQELPPRDAEAADDAPAADERGCETRTSDRLDPPTAVRDGDGDPPSAARRGPGTCRDYLDPAGGSTAHANGHDQPDAHPDCDRFPDRRRGREEHDRGVIAGAGARWAT
jgi:hypothetical protein